MRRIWLLETCPASGRNQKLSREGSLRVLDREPVRASKRQTLATKAKERTGTFLERLPAAARPMNPALSSRPPPSSRAPFTPGRNLEDGFESRKGVALLRKEKDGVVVNKEGGREKFLGAEHGGATIQALCTGLYHNLLNGLGSMLWPQTPNRRWTTPWFGG